MMFETAPLNPERVMPSRLHVPSATAQERGRVRGSVLEPLIRDAIDSYTTLFDDVGISTGMQRASAIASFEALRHWDPLQHAEMVSVAQTAGVTPVELALVVARTEILAAAGRAQPECSALVALTPDGSAVGAQTWDWHVELSHLWHLNEVGEGEGTLGHVGFAEAGMLAKIGVNSAGVGVLLNILSHDSDGPGGVPVHAVLGAVLNRAMNLDDARNIIYSAPTSASSTITVVAPQGAFVMELGPNGKAELPVSGITAHTNHFIAESMQAGARELDGEVTSHERFDKLARRIKGMAGADSASELSSLLGTAGSGRSVSMVPDYDAPRWHRPATLVSVRIDAAAKNIDLTAGSPSLVSSRDWVSLSAA